MKIENVSGYPVYTKNRIAPSSKAVGSSEAAAKTDVVDFKASQAPAAGVDRLAVRSSILREAAKPMGAEELAAIKSSIRNGTYHRSTDQLVDAILNNL